MDDPGPIHRWVADRSSARHAATALLIQELRRGRILALGLLLLVGMIVLLMTTGRTEEDHDPLLASLFSLGLVGFLVLCAVGFAHWQRFRVMRVQLPPGLEMTSQFGPDYLVLRRQWAESTLQFDGFSDLWVVHGWVLLRRRQVTTQVMLPCELLPSDDLARLRLVIAGYQPREPAEPAGPAAPDPADPSGPSEGPADREDG
jgi:hypothetical protein